MRKILILFFTFWYCAACSQEPKLMLPIGHVGWTLHAEVSPDSRTIATSSEDGVSKIWDIASGRHLANFLGFGIKYTLDGREVGTVDSGVLKIWSTYSGDLVSALKNGKSTKIETFQFSHDGKTAMTTSDDGKVVIWSQESKTKLFDFNSLPDYNWWATVYSPDGSKVVSVGQDSSLKVYNAHTGHLINNFSKQNIQKYKEPKFSPTGELLMIRTEDSVIKVWELKTKKLLLNVKIDTTKINSIHFDEGGNNLLICGERYVNILNLQSRQVQVSFDAEDGKYYHQRLTYARFAPDWRTIITSAQNTTFWDLKGHRLADFKGAFSLAANNFLVTISEGEQDTIRVFNLTTRKLLGIFNVSSDDFFDILSSNDGKKLVTITDMEKARVWNPFNGKEIASLKGFGKQVKSIEFHPDGERMLALFDVGPVELWNYSKGRQEVIFEASTELTWSMKFSPSGDKVITTSHDSTLRIYDVGSGKLIFGIRGRDDIWDAQFSPDGKMIALCFDRVIQLWNADSLKLVREIDAHNARVSSVRFNSDATQIVTSSMDSTVKIWNTIDGKQKGTIKIEPTYGLSNHAIFFPHNSNLLINDKSISVWNTQTLRRIRGFEGTDPQIDCNGEHLLTNTGNIDLFSLKSGKLILSIKASNSGITSFNYSKDCKRIFIGTADGKVSVYDSKSGTRVFEFHAHTNAVNYMGLTPDRTKFITASDDNSFKIWDARDASLKTSSYSLTNSEYITLAKSKYYLCSPGAAKLLHYVTFGLKAISFEQLDLKYNRPDLVLEALESADTNLINSYRQAFVKRLRRLGFDTMDLSRQSKLPEVEFRNGAGIEYNQTRDSLSLKISAHDSSISLDRFNFWVNEVPVLGANGFSLRARSVKTFDTTIIVELSEGINKIETSVTNLVGSESYRASLQINYMPTKPKIERMYFLGIGIDQFSDTRYNLQYSVKDIKDFLQALRTKYGENLIIVDTLFNHNVTVDAVKNAKSKLQETSIHDKVIISYSGHGLLSDSFDYYLSTHDINFQKPQNGGLPYDALENLLDGIPARKKLLLIDACHSGEVDKEEMRKYAILQDSLAQIGTKGMIVVNRDSAKIGMKNSFELMQELFVNVGRSTGATIVSAAGGMQLAQEGGDRENGVFTYSILEYMEKNPSATVTELKNYVIARVPELTKGLQQPTTRKEALAVDWMVW